MRTIEVRNNNRTIHIGKRGEYGVLTLLFPLNCLNKMYGDGRAEIIFQPPSYGVNGSEPYLVYTETVDNVLYFPITASETNTAGTAKCELNYYVNDEVLAKSETYELYIGNSLDDNVGEAPEDVKTWISSAVEVLDGLSDYDERLRVLEERDVSSPNKGDDGLSAYELALQEGFVGTLQEWLDSLKGEPGEETYIENPFDDSDILKSIENHEERISYIESHGSGGDNTYDDEWIVKKFTGIDSSLESIADKVDTIEIQVGNIPILLANI